MLTKGDKIILVAKMGAFTNVGEVCEVIEFDENGTIWFKFGDGMHMGCMSANEFEKYFKKYEEPKPEFKIANVDFDWVDKIIDEAHINVTTVFNKCTVVACQLPSGFVIVESSACTDPESYDKDMGIEICLNRIRSRICEMEAYRIADEAWDKEDFYDDSEDYCVDCKICHDNGGWCTDCLDEDEDDCDECEGNCSLWH